MNLRRGFRRDGGSATRRGSVLVVVLVLLSALMLLGFLFLTIASQERENARYFTASQKWYAAQVNPDDLFDFALEQIIVGPQDDYANSALWGGRYSLMASLVGDDLQPYSGPGVNIIQGGGPGLPAVDQTGPAGFADGVPDTVPMGADGNTDSLDDVDANNDSVHDQLALHLGEIAATAPNLQDYRFQFARPDVGYTYPDMNSPFLAYIGTEPVSGNRVIIPSFHRPQYLRGLFPGMAPTWYTDPATKPYLMRPHADRKVRYWDYNTGRVVEVASLNRFTDANVVNPPGWTEGFWTWSGSGAPTHQWDVDADGDTANGREAVLIDMDHPVEETPDGTQQFIPIYGVTLYDLDGLLNLNAHGNLYGPAESLASLPTGASGNPFDFISKSNEGRSRYEVNPQYGLDAGAGAAGPAHSDFFGHSPTSATELSNMEWWFLLAGRADYESDGTIKQPHLGRWGELDRLEAAAGARNPSAYAYPRPGESGVDDGHGDAYRGLGFIDAMGMLFPPGVVFPPPRHPVDVQGQGTYVSDTDGKAPLLVQLRPAPLQSRVPMLRYIRQWLPTTLNPGGSLTPPGPPAGYLGPLWQLGQELFNLAITIVDMSGATGVRTRQIAGLYDAPEVGLLVDDPGETWLDPIQARDQLTDSLFGVEETAFLHLPANLRQSNSILSRLLQLAPANFQDDTNAAERAKRFTTHSADLKTYSLSAARVPAYETRTDLFGSSIPAELEAAGVFPPAFGAPGSVVPIGSLSDPFRSEMRGLLQQIQRTPSKGPPNNPASWSSTDYKRLVRKLSVNHVAASYGEPPRYVLRPLTPHPPAGVLDATPIPPLSVVDLQGNPINPAPLGVSDRILSKNNITTRSMASPPAGWTAPQIREWHARRDRQNLARDIYTLLYTLNPTDDTTAGVNPITTPNVPSSTPPWQVHSPRKMREMAQFAANLVDAMDTDDAITVFVYDLNLADGYTLADDGYRAPIPNTATTYVDPDLINPPLQPPPYSSPAPPLHMQQVDEDGDGDRTNDYGYFDTTTAGNTRGMVFGVEAQQLAFSEGLALLAKKYDPDNDDMTRDDYAATDWDDEYHRDFAMVELQNLTPGTVVMNGNWSIVCAPRIVLSSTMSVPPARAVTLQNTGNLGTVTPAEVVTIGTIGDGHNTQGGAAWDPLAPPAMRPSHVAVDVQTGSTGSPALADFEQIAPVARGTADPNSTDLDFDLVFLEATTPNSFWITNVDPTNPANLSVDQTAVVQDEPDDGNGIAQGPKGGAWFNLGLQDDRDDLTEGVVGPPASNVVTFYLRRRANLQRTAPVPAANTLNAAQQTDNPWIIVDRIDVPLSVLDLEDDTTAADTVANLAEVKSHQRDQVLVNVQLPVAVGANSIAPPPITTNDPAVVYRRNNVGMEKPKQFAQERMVHWQRHFDRPFASVADLLNVPLYGPQQLTQMLPSWIRTTPVEGDPAVTLPGVSNRYQLAAAKILFPEARPPHSAANPPPLPAGSPYEVGKAASWWYRLLEFLEVPHKYGDNDQYPWFAHYAGPSPWSGSPYQNPPEAMRVRDFGKININTLRQEHVLAGLLDDWRVVGMAPNRMRSRWTPLPNTIPALNNESWSPTLPGGGPYDFDGIAVREERDWWLAVLGARDGGFDPYSFASFGQAVILPGVPSARPFQGFAFPGGIGQSLLRSMPGDPEPTTSGRTRRSLFELGNDMSHPNPPGGPLPIVPARILGGDDSLAPVESLATLRAEFSTRYRLLGKVLNHGTTRSNTYLAFLTCDFYEATGVDHDGDPNTPEVFQIGAKMPADTANPDDPRYRGVFVIDRTLAFEMLERQDLPPTQQQMKYPQTNQYSTYSFAREQGPDGRPTPRFDWRDLLLYRKITKAQ